jgi:glycosyltransferase involved in cell wall biosynthesis
MRIAYVCQYFLPEVGAPSARISELSREWTGCGHSVTVITGLPNHPTGIVPPDYRGAIFRREQLGAVEVWRNWLFATPNEGTVKKTLSHLSFMVSAALLSTPRLRGHDVIIVSSPAFFAVIAAYVMSRVWRIPYIFEVRDLWPGIFVDLGILKNRALIRILEAIEFFLYRKAARVVVVTDSFAATLAGRGLPAAKIATITNGVDGRTYVPGERENDLRRVHGLCGKFVALYIGAHGISHGLAAVLDAADRLRHRRNVVFLFVGEGAQKAMLVRRAEAMGLTNVRFLPAQPKALMPAWYAAADVALVPLRNVPLFEQFIPSKMFEIMACARPIVGSVRGEARRILERSGAALIVEPEDAEAIAAAIARLEDDPVLAARLGRAGRQFVSANYDRSTLARQYLTVLEDVCRGTARAPAIAARAVPASDDTHAGGPVTRVR